MKILIVDDKRENLIALRKILKELNIEIDEAISGNEALLKALKTNYALILLDVQMPNMNGEEVAYILSQDPQTKDIPVIFLTAINRDDSLTIQGYKTGVVDYIFKPINKEILLSKVKIFIQLFQSKYLLEQTVEEKIQDLKITYEELKVSKLKADVANEAKTEFLANMSHEIRTPMHAILSFSKSALKDLSSQTLEREKIIKKVSRIREGSERLMLLLNDLLDLSKLEAGKMNYKKSHNDIEESFSTVRGELSELLTEKELSVKLEIKAHNQCAYFDPCKIQQVLRNILSNAIKFSTKGSTINTLIHSSSTEKTDLLELSISNTGIPIPKSELLSVFDKFVQSTNTNSGSGGTGLGLPICKKIIESHQGNIWASSNEQGYTTFTFTIPRQKIKI